MKTTETTTNNSKVDTTVNSNIVIIAQQLVPSSEHNARPSTCCSPVKDFFLRLKAYIQDNCIKKFNCSCCVVESVEYTVDGAFLITTYFAQLALTGVQLNYLSSIIGQLESGAQKKWDDMMQQLATSKKEQKEVEISYEEKINVLKALQNLCLNPDTTDYLKENFNINLDKVATIMNKEETGEIEARKAYVEEPVAPTSIDYHLLAGTVPDVTTPSIPATLLGAIDAQVTT